MTKLHGLPLLLVSHLKHLSWVSKGALTADKEWRHQNGKYAGVRYLPETVGRALRSLEEKGLIAVKDEGISVVYKYLPAELRERYIPWSTRPDSLKHILFRAKGGDTIVETRVEMAGEVALPYKE